MMLSTLPRKYLYLLVGVILIIILAGRYSYDSLPEIPSVFPRPLSSSSFSSQITTSSSSFPTKIWQSWKDDAQDPTDRTAGFPHRWRALNPSWRYERITDANMDAYVSRDRFDDAVVRVFESVADPILRADFLRYLILAREGGVWADIDVYPHVPVLDWIPEEYGEEQINLVVGIENDHHKTPIWPGSPYSVQLCQYTVLAKPDHPALEALIAQVTTSLTTLLASKSSTDASAITFEDVMATTGPFAFTAALMDYFTAQTGVAHTGDELDSLEAPRLIGDVLVLPKDGFGWLPQENTHEKGDPAILVEHLFIGSWREGHPG